MRVSDFRFELPEELIASEPVEPRDSARLLVHERHGNRTRHARVRDLPRFLGAGDLMVLNDTRVLPHRLIGCRVSGGRVEVLVLEREGDMGRGYGKPARKIRLGEPLSFGDGRLVVWPLEDLGDGMFRFRLEAADGDLDAAIDAVGRAPLPPYIRRSDDVAATIDRERYQTVFARHPGAVAAPTAGLHFTERLLEELTANGVETAWVTLHVGEGTFAPVRVTEVEQHEMHEERFDLPVATAGAIERTRARGGRVVAVGTTAARTLESCAAGDSGLVKPQRGATRLFLYPGRELRVVDALLTNFHLPESTLLMLVSAFAGRDRILALYREAVRERYRFYSYGDAMLIV